MFVKMTPAEVATATLTAKTNPYISDMEGTEVGEHYKVPLPTGKTVRGFKATLSRAADKTGRTLEWLDRVPSNHVGFVVAKKVIKTATPPPATTPPAPASAPAPAAPPTTAPTTTREAAA